MGLRRALSGAVCAKMRPSGATTCARPSRVCAGWCAPAPSGAWCRTTFRGGTPSTSRHVAGSTRASSKRSSTTCARSCVWRRVAPASPARRSWTARRLQSTPESGARAGYDGHKRKKGPKLHAAVDTLGHLLALQVTPADAQDRAQVGRTGRRGAGGHRRDRPARRRRPGLHRHGTG